MIWADIAQAIIIPVLTALGGWLAGQIKANKEKAVMQSEEWKKEHQALLTGMALMLRKQIEAIYDEYQESEIISMDTKEELDEIYQTYKALGGNHRGDTMYQILNSKAVQ